MARPAREAGASTVVATVTPLELEGKARSRTADIAFAHLKREADLVVRFSNQKLMDATGDDVIQEDFFTIKINVSQFAFATLWRA